MTPEDFLLTTHPLVHVVIEWPLRKRSGTYLGSACWHIFKNFEFITLIMLWKLRSHFRSDSSWTNLTIGMRAPKMPSTFVISGIFLRIETIFSPISLPLFFNRLGSFKDGLISESLSLFTFPLKMCQITICNFFTSEITNKNVLVGGKIAEYD